MHEGRRGILVYPAGPIQGAAGAGGGILTWLHNLRRGQEWTARLFDAGFSPFPVFTDAAFLDHCEPVPRIEDVYAYSLAWLRKADALFLLPGWEDSKGAQQERSFAERLSIPVFFELNDLCRWADELIDSENEDPVKKAERIANLRNYEGDGA